MSSNRDSSESSSPHFTAPSCTMCELKNESKSYCLTCCLYLCERCDFGHRLIVRFSTHQMVPLENISNVEDLEKILNPCPESNIKDILENQFWEGTRYANRMLQQSYELKKSLEKLSKHRLETLNCLNEVHKRCEEYLRQMRDKIVQNVEEQYVFHQRLIVAKQQACDADINSLLVKLSDLKMMVENNGNGAGAGVDFNFFDAIPNGEGLSQNGDESSDAASGLSLNNTPNVIPYAPINLPVVESQHRVYVNPDLSLSISNPESPPVTSNVNTIQIYKTFGQKGNDLNQFNSPHGFCIGFGEDIVVADSSNHRIQIFDKTGLFKSQFGVAGRHDGYMWHPRKVAYLPSQKRYVVCDRGYERSRMQIFTETGKFLKKIYIQYIDIVAGIAVTDKEEIVVINSVTPTVFIIGENDFLRSIDCTGFMQEPSDIAVAGNELYICDFKGHCVVVIDLEGNFLRRFGTKHTTVFPNGIAISPNGNVLIGDSHGNFFHIVIYTKDGIFISEYRCPYIKVSRCCGLKITNEGRVVTVDKNYHHVIMLEAPVIKE